MPILVKHSGNVAPAAYGAYAGGKGKRQQQDADRALTHIEQQQRIRAQAQAQASSQWFSSQEAKKNRKFSAEQRESDRAFQLDRDKTVFDRGQEAADAAQTRTGELAEEAYGRRKEEFSYEMSEKQRQEENRFADAYDDAVSSGLYSPEELKTILKERIAKRAGVPSLPRLKPKSPWPEGQEPGQSWKDPETGHTMTRDDKGNQKVLHKAPDTKPTVKEKIDGWKLALEMSRGGEEGTPNIKKAREIFNEIMGIEEEPPAAGAPESSGSDTDYESIDGGIRTEDGIDITTTEGMKAFRHQQSWSKGKKKTAGQTPESVIEAVRAGTMTKEEAAAIGKKNGWK